MQTVATDELCKPADLLQFRILSLVRKLFIVKISFKLSKIQSVLLFFSPKDSFCAHLVIYS